MSSTPSLLANTTIAVVGGGNVGSTLADSIEKAPSNQKGENVTVIIAARNVEKTKGQLEEKNKGHLTVQPMAEAIAAADIILLATPGGHSDEAIQVIAQSLGEAVAGKIIVDATNPLSDFGSGLNVRWEQGISGGEVLAQHLPDSCFVYKSFNTLGVELMSRPRCEQNVDMMFAGPEEKKDTVAALVRAVGFSRAVHVGPLRYARNLEAMAELWIHCAIPPLPGSQLGRDWSFGLSGNASL